MADITQPTNGATLHQLFKDKGSAIMTTEQGGIDRHRVTALQDTKLAFPLLYLSVHVLGDSWEQASFAQFMARSGCKRAPSLEEADLVVFTGGADVDSRLYGEEAHKTTRFIPQRDTDDITAYMKCVDLGIPMFGVCRGAQFIHVMNGGKLYQDVDGHEGAHGMWDENSNVFLASVSSVHHQLCRENKENGMQLIAYSRGQSKKRWLNNTSYEEGGDKDIEAFFYPGVCAFGVQGHPEYKGYAKYSLWCLQQIEELVTSNPATEWRDKALRLRVDYMEANKPKTPEPNKSKTRSRRKAA